MNILIVDDDRLDRMSIKRTLAKTNISINVTETSTVDEGLFEFANNDFDIVLLDYRLPRRDGIEMIVELRNEPKSTSTAIVMMSSSEDEEIAINSIRAGAQDFLVKSEITEIRLRRAIEHATARFELEKQLYDTYQQVKVLAETDSLTELPNRYIFDEHLKQAIIANQRDGHMLALLLLDLDNFKLINDNFGHDIGDLILKKVAKQIKGCLRGGELFARLGGDEFAIILPSLIRTEQASQVAQRIISTLQNPIKAGRSHFTVTSSIGIALHPENGKSNNDLFKYADIAMYRAKKLGRNQLSFFHDEMQVKFQQRLQIETQLRDAIEKNQFRLHYQPVVNPEDSTLIGFEALIRWHIEGAVRSPIDFIEVAEEIGVITEIGGWVADNAIATLAEWNKGRNEPLHMAINVSPVQLKDEGFPERLKQYLIHHDVPPVLVEIELTETALLADTAVTKKVISEISEIGCRLSLDDFGTGFSSLSHLHTYPISVIKIDKHLMPKESENQRSVSLIEGISALATTLKLRVVAEGIETEEHVRLCNRLKIGAVQGFYYSKPMPAEDCHTILNSVFKTQ